MKCRKGLIFVLQVRGFFIFIIIIIIIKLNGACGCSPVIFYMFPHDGYNIEKSFFFIIIITFSLLLVVIMTPLEAIEQA
jgi:hypothetical protein